MAFEQYRGCFETPSMTKEPDTDIDCPSVAPLTFSNCIVNREAMNDPNKLVHPDSPSLVRYCLGTRIQMQQGKPSHKLKTCQFHDVNKSRQGQFLRTMTQEAMNVSSTVDLSRAPIWSVYSGLWSGSGFFSRNWSGNGPDLHEKVRI